MFLFETLPKNWHGGYDQESRFVCQIGEVLDR